MKPGPITNGKKTLLIFIAAFLALAFISWDNQQRSPIAESEIDKSDTIPQKKEKKVRDLDEAIAELDNLDIQVHLDKAMKEVEMALKQLDKEKIKLDIERSMKEVDMEKIKTEISEAMKEVDMAKIEKEVKESIAKVDFEKMSAELAKMKKIDMAELDAELGKTRKQLEKLGPEIRRNLDAAKVEIEKAKVELKEYKSFVDGLTADGLINKKDGYTIKHKDGKLLINDKEANARTYEKYKSFLQKHKNFKIENDLDDFNIDVD